MIKCKHCGGSEFGVIEKKVIETPFKMINEKDKTPLSEPEERTEIIYNYCFTCKANITNDDVEKSETCVVCGKSFSKLTNGRCSECNKEAELIGDMDKEDMLNMIMKLMKNNSVDLNDIKEKSTKNNKKDESKKDKKEPKAVKNNKKNKYIEDEKSDNDEDILTEVPVEQNDEEDVLNELDALGNFDALVINEDCDDVEF